MSTSNQIWNFFASVKLALFTIGAIAATSVIGTVIPQKKTASFYISQYGESTARFFQILDIPDMYGSWWFLSLLGLLCANLIVCSIDRIPPVIKQIKTDPSSFKGDRIRKMPFTKTIGLDKSYTAEEGRRLLEKNKFTVSERETETDLILAGNRGKWSRTGVYIVHLSILVIFFGAIVGHFTGFKGSVMIPETKVTDKIFNSQNSVAIDLGFEVRCNWFDIEFYDNGMPKEYVSNLSVLENGVEVLNRDIQVNSPLKYKGITFYQASYEGYRDFVISIDDPKNETPKTFITPFQQQANWSERNLTFGIVNAEALRDRVVRIKLWVKAKDSAPVTGWLHPGEPLTVQLADGPIQVSAKQMYATGLQVAKDPGVLIVYLGCLLMMVGLYAAFFMSHQRVWLLISKKDKSSIFLAGSTHKNKIGFEKVFTELLAQVQQADMKQ